MKSEWRKNKKDKTKSMDLKQGGKGMREPKHIGWIDLIYFSKNTKKIIKKGPNFFCQHKN
jgi:hypothetical protein